MTSADGDCSDIQIELPDRLDFDACGSLCDTIMQHHGQPVRLGAAGVRFIGGLAAEILLRARAEWSADELDFSVTDPSKELLQGLALLGIPQEQLIPETSE